VLGQTIYNSMFDESGDQTVRNRSRNNPTFREFAGGNKLYEYVRCVSCETIKPAGAFSKNQQRKPAENRKCKNCTGAAQNVETSTTNNADETACDESASFSGFSTKCLANYVFEISGGEEGYDEINDLYTIGLTEDWDTYKTRLLLGGPDGPKLNLTAREAQQRLLEMAKDDGSSMAQYMIGKIYRDEAVSVFGKFGSNEKATIKYWSAAALQGNALAMAGLGLLHRDDGCTSTAIHWWERALSAVAMPEAAYNIGVMYGKEGVDSAINYRQAAHHYSHCVLIDTETYQIENAKSTLIAMVNAIGPNNDNQVEYQPLARVNLSVVERYISKQLPGPEIDSIELPPFVDSEEACAMCGKRPRVGELALLSCAACKSVNYCNSICQKGHWYQVHKSTCC
jgi:hypothetical protein